MINVPDGWLNTTLGEIGNWSSGGTPSRRELEYYGGGIPWVKTGDLPDGIIEDIDETITEDGLNNSSAKIFPESSLIVAMYGATIGKLGILNAPAATNQACAAMIASGLTKEIIKYTFYYLLERREELREIGKGGAQPNISQTVIKKFPIPLPPLNEQRRIVAKIEELTDRTRKAREALEDVPQLIEQFRRSVLAAAFRGDLTADWREQNPDVEPAEKLLERSIQKLAQKNKKLDLRVNRDHEDLPPGWHWAKLGSFTNQIQAGKNFSCPEEPVKQGSIGLVKISAVTWGEFDPKETKTVTDLKKVDPKLFIQEGDFLISRANTIELVGSSVVVREIEHQIMLSDKVWRVIFEEISPQYVHHFLKSSQGRKEIEARATGNQLSMRNISQKAFKDIVIPIPPLKEQIAIVEHIEATFARINSVKRQNSRIVSVSEELDRAILAKAFRGELVPQDPTDEPASILLDRIRSERQKTTPSPRKTQHRAPAPQRDRESAPT